MGCWNGTCMISNLPILAGEEVKLVFIYTKFKNKNSLCKSAYCYPNGIFNQGAFALDAEYDDYGTVENIKEDINFELINIYFQQKYKRIKVEEKELETYTIYNIIEGIERGSLEVFSEGDVEGKKLAQKAVEVYSKEGYSSDKIKKEWEDLANLDVSPQWRSSDYNFVLIRKDIWDGICKSFKGEFFKDPKDRLNKEDYTQTINEWVQKRFDRYTKNKKKITENPLDTGQNFMFMMPIYIYALSQFANKEIQYFQNLFTESTIIESFLSCTRRGWMIVSGAGSQGEDWENYLLLNRIVDDICNNNLKKEIV